MIALGFSVLANGDLYERRYGLRFVGHDAAEALLVDGELVFAAEEERFSRVKHASALPIEAARAALKHAGLRWSDEDRLAYLPRLRCGRRSRSCPSGFCWGLAMILAGGTSSWRESDDSKGRLSQS